MKRFFLFVILFCIISSCAFADTPSTFSDPSGSIQLIAADITPSGDLVAIFENVSDKVIPDFNVDIVHRDENGIPIGTSWDGHDAVLPGSKVVSRLRLWNVEKGNIATFDISISAGRSNNYINHAKDIIIKTFKNSKNIMAEIKNNSDICIEEIEIVIVFFDSEGKIIGSSEEEETDVPAGDTIFLQFSLPYDGRYETIDYDHFEVFVNQAHTFNLW